MKISKKISFVNFLLITILGIAAFLITLTILNNLQEREEELFATQIRNSIQKKSDDNILSIQKRINAVSERALDLAALVTNDEDVINAYKIAHSGNIDNPESPESQRARDMLREKFKPLIVGYLKGTGRSILKLHFHLPNSRSLVRLWRDGYQTIIDEVKFDISDDLSSFRHTVAQVNTSPYKSLTGIEIGRGGFVTRGLASIDTEDGIHLGSAEVLFPMIEVIQKEMEGTNNIFAVYMDIAKLETARSLKNPETYPIFQDKYVLTDYTDKEAIEKLITLEILDKGMQEVFRIEIGNTSITSFPILDYSGVPSGIMVFSFDISEENQALINMNQSMNKAKLNFVFLFSSIIGVIVILGLFLSLILIRITIKPLKLVETTMEEIASGKGDLTVSLDIQSRDEIGNLSTSF
ncbi:MAG: HAMP domain-containing protein, partial [Spirochaetales bacterium]|nr:HAMP domain-containing protein [Spirochaetales bacterium]